MMLNQTSSFSTVSNLHPKSIFAKLFHFITNWKTTEFSATIRATAIMIFDKDKILENIFTCTGNSRHHHLVLYLLEDHLVKFLHAENLQYEHQNKISSKIRRFRRHSY